MSTTTQPRDASAPALSVPTPDLARRFGPPVTEPRSGVAAACRVFIALLATRYELLAVKRYRVGLQRPLPLPEIPCLDHEATIHEENHPHVSLYLRDESDALHEVMYYPAQGRIVLDRASTLGDHSERSSLLLQQCLAEWFPECQLQVHGISWMRADRRVAATAQAHAPLRDVLCEPDLERLREPLHRLSIIANLIEKNSRVSSWSVRTAYSPLVAAVGVVLYLALEGAADQLLSTFWREVMRYGLLAAFATLLVYFGLRAVHLTQIGTRLWKRAEEYRLVIESRRALDETDVEQLIASEAPLFEGVDLEGADLAGDPLALKASWLVVSGECDPQLATLASRARGAARNDLVAAWRVVAARQP